MNTLRYAWDVVLSDPTTLAAALMMAAALLALVLIATPPRGRSAATSRRRRPAEARTMAAAGRPTAEIARRTGLSRDAIALVLAGTSVPSPRKGRPVAASFSFLPARPRVASEQRAAL